MAHGKLDSLIEKETKNIEKWEKKKLEAEKNIKKSKAKLQEYQMMQDSQMFNTISNIVQNSGLSIDEVLVALKNGDLLSLQEQMEERKNTEISDEVTNEHDETNGEGME